MYTYTKKNKTMALIIKIFALFVWCKVLIITQIINASIVLLVQEKLAFWLNWLIFRTNSGIIVITK